MRALATVVPVLVLAAIIARAVLGRPPAHPPARNRVLMAAGVAGLADAIAAVLMLRGHPACTWAAFVGAATGSLAMWLARASGPGRDDDGGEPRDDEPRPVPGGPQLVDWDAFDRARSGWRPRQRA